MQRLSADSTLHEDIDIFIFDCDGVIWKGNHVIDGAVQTLQKLRNLGKHVVFVTNNSTLSRKSFLKKFQRLGIPAEEHEIFSSSFAAAVYFTEDPLPPNKKVYVVGQEGICEELTLAGIPWIGGPAHANIQMAMPPTKDFEYDKDIEAVVVGLDFGLNYFKIQYAQLCLNSNRSCRFIATNEDSTTHMTVHQEWAGNGACVGAVRGCTNREPIVVGKPSALILTYIMKKFDTCRERILMVGDRLDTDVLFGKNNGLKTLLVLSGVTTESQLKSDLSTAPDYYAESIASIGLVLPMTD